MNTLFSVLPGILFLAETRGGKYAFEIRSFNDGYALTHWTNGLQRGVSVRYSLMEIKALARQLINDSAHDGINYIVRADFS